MLSDTARLGRIRAELDAIAPGQWSRVHDDEGCFVEARGAFGELVQVARFHLGASEEEIALICDLPDTLRFLIGLVDRAIEKLRPPRNEPANAPEARDPKNFAAECGMLCSDGAFKVFLEQKHGLERPLTDERVAQKVRSLLSVTSRAALNDDARAAASWKALRDNFKAWKRTQR